MTKKYKECKTFQGWNEESSVRSVRLQCFLGLWVLLCDLLEGMKDPPHHFECTKSSSHLADLSRHHSSYHPEVEQTQQSKSVQTVVCEHTWRFCQVRSYKTAQNSTPSMELSNSKALVVLGQAIYIVLLCLAGTHVDGHGHAKQTEECTAHRPHPTAQANPTGPSSTLSKSSQCPRQWIHLSQLGW